MCQIYNLLFLMLIFFNSCLSDDKKNTAKTLPDEALQETWTQFKKAVLNNNWKNFKLPSADTIRCKICTENTEDERKVVKSFMENNSVNWVEYNNLESIPIGEFINNDFRLIFNENLKTRINDNSKVKYLAPHKYNSNHEFAILTLDPSINSEGQQIIIAFKPIGNKYKFGEIWTVP